VFSMHGECDEEVEGRRPAQGRAHLVAVRRGQQPPPVEGDLEPSSQRWVQEGVSDEFDESTAMARF
jgi:hypothetical protein